MYARQLAKGRDIGESFSRFMDGVLNLFKKKEKKAPLKTVYRNQKTTKVRMSKDYDKESHQRKVDIILDKISKSGYESLSKAEKDFLFKAGKENWYIRFDLAKTIGYLHPFLISTSIGLQ